MPKSTANPFMRFSWMSGHTEGDSIQCTMHMHHVLATLIKTNTCMEYYILVAEFGWLNMHQARFHNMHA